MVVFEMYLSSFGLLAGRSAFTQCFPQSSVIRFACLARLLPTQPIAFGRTGVTMLPVRPPLRLFALLKDALARVVRLPLLTPHGMGISRRRATRRQLPLSRQRAPYICNVGTERCEIPPLYIRTRVLLPQFIQITRNRVCG